MEYPITIISGWEKNATYIIRDGDDCAVIDPSTRGLTFIRKINSLGDSTNLKLKIILTHGHEDHISAVTSLMKKFPTARILIAEADKPWLFDPVLNGSNGADEKPINLKEYESSIDTIKEGDVISVGKYNYKVISTPGHTPGSVLFVDDENKLVFTGDVLFKNSIGVTHFQGGNKEEMHQSLKRIFREIPHDYAAYPGHGESTTIGNEYDNNQFSQIWKD